MVLDGGSLVPTGTTVSALVVDCLPEVADSMRPFYLEEEALIAYDPGDPLALSSVDGLVVESTRWIAGHQDGRASFYSAEGAPKTRRTRRPRIGTAKATPSGKKQEKGARVTTGSLAANLETLMDMIPALSEQVSTWCRGNLSLQPRNKIP